MPPTPKKLYIHIGYPKTGTSSIQAELVKHRETLKDMGYRVLPEHSKGKGLLPSPALMRYESAEPRRFIVIPNSVKRFVKSVDKIDAPNIIISTENFSHLQKADIRKLRKHIPQHIHPIIVVYLRRQDQQIQSWWAQHVKHMMTSRSFESYVEYQLDNERYKLDYDMALSWWEDVFGIENMRVRVFNRVIKEKDLFHDFLEACDIQDTGAFVTNNQRNPSPSLKSLTVLRQIAVKLDWPYDRSSEDHMLKRKAIAGVRRHMFQLGWNNDRLNLITPEFYTRIRDTFAESNASVAQRYFGQDTLFVEPFEARPVSKFDLERDVSHQEMLGLITGLVQDSYNHFHDEQQAQVEIEQLRKMLRKSKRQLKQERRKLTRAEAKVGALQANLQQLKRRQAKQEKTTEQLNRQLARTQLQLQNVQNELELRNALPLTRVSEVLYGAQREWRQNGIAGFVKRGVAWLQGERQAGDREAS